MASEHGGFTGIRGFLETSFVDWPGNICAVLFLGGCNFRCPYCHNPHLVLSPTELDEIPWEDVASSLRRLRGWVDGVCITGGEPTLHPQLMRLLWEIQALGLQAKLDTNGSRPHVIAELLIHGLLQAVSIDLKAPLRAVPYARACGVDPPLEEIRRSLEILGGSSVELEFRTTVVPGLVEEGDLLEMASSLPSRGRYTLQGFRPGSTLDPRLGKTRALPQEELERLRGAVQRVRQPAASNNTPLSHQQAHGLQMEGLGEHVEGLESLQPISPL